MPDSNLNSSISSLVTKITNEISSANVDELLQLARAAEQIGESENADIETAINTRINQLINSATAGEIQKLSATIKKMRTTPQSDIISAGIGDISELTDNQGLLVHVTDVSELTDNQGLLVHVSDISELTDTTGLLGGTLGTLTKSFTENEEATITLSESVSPVPSVSVFKEIPQPGIISKGNWDVNSTASNYDFYDEAQTVYSNIDITPSNSTENGIFTLSSGTFSASDIGKRVLGNGGEAIIVAADGSYTIVSSFNNTDTITSGSWNLYAISGNNDGITLSSGSSGGGGLDVSNASYSGESFPIGNNNAYAISFGNGGLRLYYLNSSDDSVYQFNLSAPFDITSAVYVNKFWISEDNLPQELTFNSTGTKMYIIGFNKTVLSYTLSNPWEVVSASFDGGEFLVNSVSSPYLEDMAFSVDGTKLYLINRVTAKAFQFNLSTAWDVSTASFFYKLNLNISSPISIEFNNTGTRMFILAQNDRVKQFDLSTAWNLSTATLSSTQGPNFDTQDTSSRSFVFNNTGTKMYMFGATTDSVYQYSLSSAYSISTATYDGVSLSAQNFSTQFEWAKFSPNGSYLYIALSNTLYKYSLSTAWDLSTATYSANFSLAYSAYTIEFGNNGNNLYFMNSTNIYNKSLSSQDITSTTTPPLVNFLDITGQDSQPLGLVFNDTGSKMFVLGLSGGKIFQYNLSTPFDITTVSYNSVSLDFAAQTNNGNYFDFNSDGTILLLLNYSADVIYQYSLTTPYDLATASYTGISTNVIVNEGSAPQGIEISDDDSSIFILQTASPDTIFKYSLSATIIAYNQYFPAITNETGQINTTTWEDINDMTADENVGEGEIYYAISTDNRITWKVAKNGEGERSIVRNNNNIWQYNSNENGDVYTTTEIWTNSTYNNEQAALQQALSIGINRMNSTQLSGLDDTNEFVLGDSLDLMIAPYMSTGTTPPISDGVTIDYDAKAILKQAINGTDYEVEFAAPDSVKIISLAAQNLKIRVV